MSGEGFFPFDPERLTALGRLSQEINGRHAPPPIAQPVMIEEDGHIWLPIAGSDGSIVSVELHAGMTLQWAPMPPQDGLVVEFRGGEPDGAEWRDAVAVFLTQRGLRALIADLQAIDAQLGGCE